MIFVLAATKNFYQYLPINIFNIIRTNECGKIYIFIEDDKLNLPFSKIDIQYINMHKIGLDKNGANYNTNFSIASLCRLYIPQIIPEEKIIYCDIDTLVIGNLRQWWDTDMSDYYVSGVADKGILDYKDYVNKFLNPDSYINAGVILMNLKKIREENQCEKLVEFINKNRLAFPDQDAINFVLGDKVLLVDSKFNAGQATSIPHSFLVFHWAGLKQNWVYDREFGYLWMNAERAFISMFAQPINKD